MKTFFKLLRWFTVVVVLAALAWVTDNGLPGWVPVVLAIITVLGWVVWLALNMVPAMAPEPGESDRPERPIG